MGEVKCFSVEEIKIFYLVIMIGFFIKIENFLVRYVINNVFKFNKVFLIVMYFIKDNVLVNLCWSFFCIIYEVGVEEIFLGMFLKMFNIESAVLKSLEDFK